MEKLCYGKTRNIAGALQIQVQADHGNRIGAYTKLGTICIFNFLACESAILAKVACTSVSGERASMKSC